jgi:micrococcal nuclease
MKKDWRNYLFETKPFFFMKKDRYIYNAQVVSVYDGDTITIDVDLGMRCWLKGQVVRLAEIDAAELKGNERSMGLAVRDYVRRRVLDKEVVIETVKDTKETYGRWLAYVWVGDVCLNAELQEKGLAPKWKG